MRNKKSHFLYMGILLALMFLLLLIPFNPLAGAEDANGGSSWTWSKANPKPAWWQWDSGGDKPVRGGYVRLASPRYIGLMNPNHWPVYDWRSILEIYEHLVNIGGDYRPTTNWLAVSYQYLDPLTCVMKIRQNVKFHDGSDLTAESVKYTVDWIKDRRNGAWTRSLIKPLKSVEVVDAYTVKFHFDAPWAAFLGMMSTVPGSIISQKALEGEDALKHVKKITHAKEKLGRAEEAAKQAKAEGKSEANNLMAEAKKLREALAALEKQYPQAEERARKAKKLDTNPVGTGRYMLEEGRPGNYLKLKRNPNWWFGKTIGRPDMPYPDGLITTVIGDPAVQLANLRAGKLHAIGIAPSSLSTLKSDPNLWITSLNQNHSFAMRFNTQTGPCKNLLVRKAVSHAIDRQALVAGIVMGQARVSSCLFNPEHWCHNPNLKPVTYDPELSKKLLAEAGYPNGLTLSGYATAGTGWESLAEAIKSMLAKVGIEWRVVMLEMVAVSDKMKNLEYDLAQGGMHYLKDPDMPVTGLYHPDGGFNFGRSNNPKVIELLLAGRAEMDEAKRQQIYWELEKAIYENYEDAWLFWPITNTARSKKLLGYDPKFHQLGGDAYWCSHPEYLKDGQE